MYRTQYSQKFYSRGINARKNNLFSEEKESFTEIKINKKMQTTKDSFKLFINLKNLKNPFKKKDILTPRNQDIIPNLTNLRTKLQFFFDIRKFILNIKMYIYT